ncbi:MAG: hypothetical protein J6B75_06060 [Ruminococcus sp.]|nr:hypothetical protein [Ruminococcus sp.]
MNNDDKQFKSLKTKPKIIISVLAVLLLLCGAIVLFLHTSFKPTVLNKQTFSDSDKAVISTELDIPDNDFSVKEMRFDHAKDSYFCVTVTTSSLDLLASYEYQREDHNGNPYYVKKDNDDPHNDVVCTVISDQPYELDFELHNWNEKLYDVVK